MQLRNPTTVAAQTMSADTAEAVAAPAPDELAGLLSEDAPVTGLAEDSEPAVATAAADDEAANAVLQAAFASASVGTGAAPASAPSASASPLPSQSRASVDAELDSAAPSDDDAPLLERDAEGERLAHSRSAHDYRYSPGPPLSDSPRHFAAAKVAAAPYDDDDSSSAAPTVDLSAIGVWRHTVAAIRCNPTLVLNSGAGRMALLGVGLGVGLGIGSQWVLLGGPSLLRQFGLYVVAMCAFHLLEFVWTAIFHPNKLSAQSYLLNHSREYHLALGAGVFEFLVEAWLFPGLKYPSSFLSTAVMLLGLLLVALGQTARTLAMLTAADNFTHIVADSKAPNHQLVTHGIYSICRHPSYAGWFWWSVGTQVLLCNPLCTVAYAAASFLFFRTRIRYEERAMRRFFGAQYERYQQRVGTGLPFIRGFVGEERP